MTLPINNWIGMRLLKDCKTNFSSNSKSAIRTSPNTSRWERPGGQMPPNFYLK